jgi:DNA-binding IclR family transcriptional regulator
VYAKNFGESAEGLHGLAVPVLDRFHKPIAALAIAAPAGRVGRDHPRAALGGSFRGEPISAAERVSLGFAPQLDDAPQPTRIEK